MISGVLRTQNIIPCRKVRETYRYIWQPIEKILTDIEKNSHFFIQFSLIVSEVYGLMSKCGRRITNIVYVYNNTEMTTYQSLFKGAV